MSTVSSPTPSLPETPPAHATPEVAEAHDVAAVEAAPAATHVWVLPISGGHFPLQLAEVLWLLPTCRPAIALGSSGGNIAAYLATAGAWTPGGLHAAIGNMHSNLFIKSWWPSYLPYLPSVLKGYFKGSAYDSNDAFLRVFADLFSTPEAADALAATELWTGTYNTSLGATQLFCNRGADATLLKPSHRSDDLLNVVPPIYAGYDREVLARSCFASASVPAIFPPHYINGSYYIDGGTAYSSPLTVLQPALRRRFGKPAAVHLTYLSPYNIQAPAFTECYEPILKANLTHAAECVPGTMYNQGVDAVSEILKSSMLQDRMAGVTLVGDPDELEYTEAVMTYDEFQTYQTKRLTQPRSCTEVYPLSSERISIVSFTPDDIERAIASVKTLGVRTWLPADAPAAVRDVV
jgi:hypothetical protein